MSETAGYRVVGTRVDKSWGILSTKCFISGNVVLLIFAKRNSNSNILPLMSFTSDVYVFNGK